MNKKFEAIIKVISRRRPFLYLWKLYKAIVNPTFFVKSRTIINYAKSKGIDVLIETGTYLGDTIWEVKDIFKEIYTIELDEFLASEAKKRFSSYSHIHVIQGDSAKVIPHILDKLSKPALFWLDAHYSGGITAKGVNDTPILSELNWILRHKNNHIILIDDANSFIGKWGYPTIEELKQFVQKYWEECIFEIKDNIIIIYPTSV
jgi:hypothetical protein